MLRRFLLSKSKLMWTQQVIRFKVLGHLIINDLKKNSANGQKCFSFREAELWNSLPADSKTASSLNGFKKSIMG